MLSVRVVKRTILLLILIGLSGCGTLNTVTQPDQTVASRLKQQNTYCTSLPRIYSGVTYNLCQLYSSPGSGHFAWSLDLYIIDSLMSAVIDTVLLPYTGYRQIKDGSIHVQTTFIRP